MEMMLKETQCKILAKHKMPADVSLMGRLTILDLAKMIELKRP
jgi:uncharacterized protein YejL (UPF0352 family)